MMEDNSIFLDQDCFLKIQKNVPERILKKIPYFFFKQHILFPIEEKSNRIVVGAANPNNISALDELRFMLDKPLEVIFLPKESVLKMIEEYYGKRSSEAKDYLIKFNEEEGSQNHEKSLKSDNHNKDLLDSRNEEPPVIKFLNLILKEAVESRASDIHFEPCETILKIRYRIDGILYQKHVFPEEHKGALIARIKVMASLDIAEQRLPQDGRIKITIGTKEIDLRVSVIPTSNGERIVLRVLDKGNVILGIDQLGMPKKTLETYKEMLTSPGGIILVTGPTGSGKTTTLYSSLCNLPNDTTNIMTIEDPIEYKLKGVSQLSVHPKIGLTFSSGLRHLLRQDPDVLMVGEIRDSETADIAIRAALTGHLVFSSLHTQNAATAIPRLQDMKIDSYLLSSTIIGIIAQRLVRKICPKCKQECKPSKEEKNFLSKHGISIKDTTFYKGKGCDFCMGSGYKYRHGVYELLKINNKLRSLITSRSSIEILLEEARKEGFFSLLEHGLILVKEGITTITEVLRVTRQQD